MADEADERLRALKGSMKEALGKLTGSDELEAQGARERSGEDVVERKVAAPEKARTVPPAKKAAASRGMKTRSTRRKT